MQICELQIFAYSVVNIWIFICHIYHFFWFKWTNHFLFFTGCRRTSSNWSSPSGERMSGTIFDGSDLHIILGCRCSITMKSAVIPVFLLFRRKWLCLNWNFITMDANILCEIVNVCHKYVVRVQNEKALCRFIKTEKNFLVCGVVSTKRKSSFVFFSKTVWW